MFYSRVFSVLFFGVWLASMLWEALWHKGLSAIGDVGGAYPVWILGVAFFLLTLHLIFNILPLKSQDGGQLRELLPENREENIRLLCFILLWFAYISLLPVFGFILATFVAVAGSVLLLIGMRLWWIVISASLIFTLIIKIVFQRVFYVLLPDAGIDEWLNDLFYQL